MWSLTSSCNVQLPLTVTLPSVGHVLRTSVYQSIGIPGWSPLPPRCFRKVVVFDDVGESRRMIVPVSSSSGKAVIKAKLDKLEGIKVYDTSGSTVSLVGLWDNRRVVIAFTRHFGCILCRKRAALLQSRKGEMDAAGVTLVLIAPGSHEQARQFVEQTKFEGEVYADPAHASYDALEFANGLNSVVNPKSGGKVVQAFLEGYRQDWGLSFYKQTLKRGGWQQGGILVVGPGTKNLHYLFKDVAAGDEPQMQDVISACCTM